MGGKASKTAEEPTSELNRSKSFSSFGRSSQRSLFHKSKARLTQINKNLNKHKEKDNPEGLDDIKKQLEGIEKELKNLSQAIKEKNKQKYEEVCKYLQETQEKFEAKTEPTVVEEKSTPEPVELTLVKIIPNQDEDVELRESSELNETVEERRSPKVKFGIQVMPINPRVSQELLKRNTLPINEAPKAEFLNIRQRAQSDGQVLENEVYNYPNQQLLNELQKRQVNVTVLDEIESITHDIDILEDRLKYFHGTNQDEEYIHLNELFIRSLLKLDNLDTQGDPVVRQERKISIQRIQELMKILECLGRKLQEADLIVEKRQEEVVNAEGKPITATAL